MPWLNVPEDTVPIVGSAGVVVDVVYLDGVAHIVMDQRIPHPLGGGRIDVTMRYMTKLEWAGFSTIQTITSTTSELSHDSRIARDVLNVPASNSS